ncbi:hypothetical protein QQ008_02325 [Fulvivirgaceae bacterium BMA10]|uniref:DUF3467 domain-containing protein n=1 Tax=Splendidivirga corallicola TaxID=3051826 RepID=A0ABT8KHI2_9BACT|nr:hypothetical protein [Fulvivirgaceae bacterium BMA10]
MSNQQDKKPVPIKFVDNDVESVFTDIVQINIDAEVVKIDIGIKSKDQLLANVSHRVIMTVPHFARFLEVGNGILDRYKKEFENFRKEQKSGNG